MYEAVRDGLKEAVEAMFGASVRSTLYNSLQFDRRGILGLKLNFDVQCPYPYAHIEFKANYIDIDVDGGYGPFLQVEYVDPLAIEKVLEFIRIVVWAMDRKYRGGDDLGPLVSDNLRGIGHEVR